MNKSFLKDDIKAELLDKNKKIIVFEETHGVRENLVLVKLFIDVLLKNKFSVLFAIEWPAGLNKEIEDFLNNKAELSWKKWPFSRSPDGRISREHLRFF